MKASSQIRRKPNSQLNSVTKKEDVIDSKVKKQNDAPLKPRTTTRTVPTTNSDIKLRKGPTKATEPAKTVSSTVLSRTKPPAKPDIKNKKVVPAKSAIATAPSKVNANAPAPSRVRTQTRTLKPEEVTVLKHVAPSASAKIPSDQHKAPVSFEVEIKSSKISDVTSVTAPIVDNTDHQSNETDNEDQYESEFESYESDFECGSSTTSKRSDSDSTSDPSDSDQSSTLDKAKECEVEEEEDRPTTEQKLDSGHYEIKIKKVQNHIENVSCSDALKSYDNQPDSGFGYSGGQNEGLSIVRLLQNRYTDILNKITLNVMPFELYEEKPASYENFLLNYATASGVLNYTQTESDAVTSETQTNEVFHRSCWSQYPAQFSKNTLTSKEYNSSYTEEKHGFGIDHSIDGSSKDAVNDVFQRLISNLHSNAAVPTSRIQTRPVTNPNQLHRFLQRSCSVMEMAMNKKRKKSSPHSAINSVNLKQNNLLQNSVVSSVQCDLSSSHVFLTLHECQVLHQSERHEYVSIWDTRRCTEPQVVLSCRENVTCIEKVGPIAIAGTSSGAICVWDIEKTDEGNGAIQIVTPTMKNLDLKYYGGVVAIKVLRQVNNLNSVMVDQIITLFETGILITWMISTRNQYAVAHMEQQNINVTFHNAEYCLSQKYCLDLKTFIEKKKSYSKETQNIPNSTTFAGEIMVNRNNVIVAMNSQLIIVNHLEQKCSAVIKVRDPTMTFMKHPQNVELMIAHSLNNTVLILRVAQNENEAWQRKRVLNKNPSLGPNAVKSPLLSNKSCAIQNIVQNERELYRGRIHGDSQTHSPGTTLYDSNLHNTSSEPLETGSMHHGQIVFLKHVPPRYRSLFFLDHERILCVDRENAVRLIHVKTKGEIKLNERIASEVNSSVRLLGMTQKKVIMAVNDQEILFYDLTELGKV